MHDVVQLANVVSTHGVPLPIAQVQLCQVLLGELLLLWSPVGCWLEGVLVVEDFLVHDLLALTLLLCCLV